MYDGCFLIVTTCGSSPPLPPVRGRRLPTLYPPDVLELVLRRIGHPLLGGAGGARGFRSPSPLRVQVGSKIPAIELDHGFAGSDGAKVNLAERLAGELQPQTLRRDLIARCGARARAVFPESGGAISIAEYRVYIEFSLRGCSVLTVSVRSDATSHRDYRTGKQMLRKGKRSPYPFACKLFLPLICIEVRLTVAV